MSNIPNDKLFTVTYIKEVFDYCSETGDLFYKERPERHFSNKNIYSVWNSKHAKRKAGYKSPLHGHLVVSIDGVQCAAHRIAWICHYEYHPNMIDHIEGNRTDNRIHMLRDTDLIGNMRNQKIPSDNKTGHMGVRFHKRDKRWMAFITVNRKQIHLGSFGEKDEAIKARKNAEKEYGFHENHGRIN